MKEMGIRMQGLLLCALLMVLAAGENSYARTFAEENDIPYVLVASSN